MTSTVRTVLAITFATPAFFLTAGALWSFARADRMARSPEALATMEQGEELDNHYFPDAELLSERGRQLRRRGKRMLQIGVILFALALPFALLSQSTV